VPRVWLSLGSNIDAQRHIRAAIQALRGLFADLVISPVYESQAVGFDGDNFLNLVIGIDTDIPLQQLTQQLKSIEDDNDRSREGDKFSSRTLDIDILTYGNQDLTASGVNIPRDEITRYAFVLKPLADVAADELHPVLGQSYASLWERFDQRSQPMQRIQLDVAAS
jgi:2-amino-4-hydroxy-6-hydroxymethyldihydropteridine diphosphokinase